MNGAARNGVFNFAVVVVVADDEDTRLSLSTCTLYLVPLYW